MDTQKQSYGSSGRPGIVRVSMDAGRGSPRGCCQGPARPQKTAPGPRVPGSRGVLAPPRAAPFPLPSLCDQRLSSLLRGLLLSHLRGLMWSTQDLLPVTLHSPSLPAAPKRFVKVLVRKGDWALARQSSVRPWGSGVVTRSQGCLSSCQECTGRQLVEAPLCCLRHGLAAAVPWVSL